ncbi:hypothetical protein VFPPC_16893 [Pochonia chlamydosporia 170]|uniref:Uncharacterized protein n=1 Tax=Pochonia chlamydosporia 170 TaxID=1380566 RepID=A0A179F140_METCM|nr:hypothetical protein VFPPC_16893 [Pochonia chlamydosporia 170]OAQ59185.1 hypothetical protein VFPPC_16893 [Pochonia chlamydosporia 170]
MLACLSRPDKGHPSMEPFGGAERRSRSNDGWFIRKMSTRRDKERQQ